MGKIYFSIGDAAKQVHMTSETLRHYDRIGLVKPSRVDEHTKYRYYNAEDIVRLNTVHALQQMDLPLQEIKRVLEYDDLEKILAFLEQAERKAEEKIVAGQQSKNSNGKGQLRTKASWPSGSGGVFDQKVPGARHPAGRCGRENHSVRSVELSAPFLSASLR